MKASDTDHERPRFLLEAVKKLSQIKRSSIVLVHNLGEVQNYFHSIVSLLMSS